MGYRVSQPARISSLILCSLCVLLFNPCLNQLIPHACSEPMNGVTPVPVVCALIERDGCVLIAQRPPGKHLPGAWEFPGGKVEPGELPETAIIREIKEELGCGIAVVRALPPFTHDYGRVVIEMIPFVVRLLPDSSEPELSEHTEMAWVKRDHLHQYDLAPADWPVIAAWSQS